MKTDEIKNTFFRDNVKHSNKEIVSDHQFTKYLEEAQKASEMSIQEKSSLTSSDATSLSEAVSSIWMSQADNVIAQSENLLDDLSLQLENGNVSTAQVTLNELERCLSSINTDELSEKERTLIDEMKIFIHTERIKWNRGDYF